MNDHADLIFVGGRVHTVNATDDVVPALAVRDGRVALAGGDAEVRALTGPGTRVVELRGRSLLPGFIDAHCHLASLGMAATSIDCKAEGMQSIRALQEAVRRRAAGQPPGTWIRGRGYDQTRLAEQRHPNRLDWDAVAPDHPVIFARTCGHISSVNSRALALAGITDATPDPPGGRYDREGGRNLGVAYETAHTPLQMAALPSREDFRQALLRADEAYITAGGTSVHDAGGLVGPAFVPAQELAAAGRLRIRVYAFATVNSRQHPLMGLLGTGVHTGLGDERLRLGAFKVMTDGSSSGPTAATREPYTSNCHDCGILYWSQEDLDDLIGQAHRQGFQCTVHAVGDRAIEQALNAMDRAQREAPREGLRHRIEHCGICPPDLRERVKRQRILPIMQPAFFWEFGDGYIANYGQHRADTMFPARSLLAAGVPVAGSSDAPVTHYAPLFGIEQALTRATMAGQVCGPDERVDLPTAIRMHTIHGAYASFEEHRKGSLEPGKLADCVVLGEDIARVPVKELRHLPVAMTIVGGQVAYEA
ncbi:MAG TPA: amidohydrolase [Methylomirabilota bacterium]|nr:amidohydrolase [Methylomirabilota bacterium]